MIKDDPAAVCLVSVINPTDTCQVKRFIVLDDCKLRKTVDFVLILLFLI